MSIALIAAAGCQGAPDLSTTAQEIVSVLPATRDFGMITVGQTSPAQTASVNPGAGNNNDVVEAVTESCPDFIVTANGLPADVYRICQIVTCVNAICQDPRAQAFCETIESQSYAFQTAFRPSVPGPQSCAVTVVLNGGTLTRTITLSGIGVAPPIDIDVVPGSLVPFGDVRTGTSSTPTAVAIRNLGAAVLDVTGVSVSAGYSVDSTAGFQLGAGGSRNLALVCSPTVVGNLAGTLTITSNDPATPTVNVPLSCNGVASSIGISPSPAVMSTTRVGEPTTQTITVVNSGGASTTLLSVSLTGTGLTLVSPPALPLTLAAGGGSAGLRVDFDAVASGESSGTLTVMTPEGPRTSQISARALLASMSLDPDGAVDFGPVCAGDSAIRQFTAIGVDPGDYRITAIQDPAPPFSVAKPVLPVRVPGSGAAQVQFSVDVTPAEPGPATSSVVVTTDIPGATPRTIELSAIGLAAGLSATPAEMDLGSPAVDTTSIGQPVLLTNCGAEATTFSNARIEGEDAAEFAIVQQPTSDAIAPTASVEWLIVLSPRSRGIKLATFAVDTPAGTHTVALTGEGFAVLPPDDGRSYYTCSAGAGASTLLWPVAIAVALALRRRRRSGSPP